MSYQIETNEIEKVCLNVSKHLADGGLFIFDFWYGPAVLADPPVVRIKRLEDESVRIVRIGEPTMHYNKNVVDVNYEAMIENKSRHSLERIAETHKMRYFFLPELNRFAKNEDLEIVSFSEWMGFHELDHTMWYGVMVVKK
jgi:hypothetical protein